MFYHGKMILKIKYLLEIFGLEEQNGVYDKKTLSCNGHSDKNISYYFQKPLIKLLLILYKLLLYLINLKAVNNHPISKMSQFLENVRFF